jgi:hypothetical protein
MFGLQATSIGQHVAGEAAGDFGSVRRVSAGGHDEDVRAVTLTCTYLNFARSGIYRYTDQSDPESGWADISRFPGNLDTNHMLSTTAMKVTIHVPVNDADLRFPDTARPPWDGWYAWEGAVRGWHSFVGQTNEELTLWDSKPGLYNPSSQLVMFSLRSTNHYNQQLELDGNSVYRISLPTLAPMETFTFAWQKVGTGTQVCGSGERFPCIFGGDGATQLSKALSSAVDRLQPMACRQEPYLEPPSTP